MASVRLLLAVALACPACVARANNVETGSRPTPYGASTEPTIPPHEPSDEATPQQLLLARAQGDAEGAAVRYLLQHEAASGAEVSAGDYRLALAFVPVEPALPGAAGVVPVHLVAVVRDGYDGRFVPELRVSAALFDAQGKRVVRGPLPFVWHPLVHHYGADLTLPGPGPYRVRLEIAPFQPERHDPINGDRYARAAVAEVGWLTADRARLDAIKVDRSRRSELARAQGAALADALSTMTASVAVDGAVTRSGDYLVAYAVEFAEGYYRWDGDDLAYDTRVEESAETNAHVEVAVMDAASGRFLPGLHVTTSLYFRGARVASQDEPLMWHPWMYHYGKNVRVPRAGKYALDVHFDPPPYRPYGSDPATFSRGASVHFEDVDVQTGQK